MGRVTYAKLIELQKKPRNIRNISILAHVDHGKTSIADLLLAENAIFSKKQAGKLRYLDNRRDEQSRGITMKSSMYSLHFNDTRTNQDYLVNLIDSPGHIDFTSEVSAATRISDGVLIVVDVVEGVCPQTVTCLELAIRDDCKMVLVLNKIDRLILEKGLKPDDIYQLLVQLIETVNAHVAEIRYKEMQVRLDAIGERTDDDDSEFDPRDTNVIFASAYDGWAFRLIDFANIQTANVQTSPNDLESLLWGDFYYHFKARTILHGAREHNKKPLFVSLILDNIFQMYENVMILQSQFKINKMITKLGLLPNARDMASPDTRIQLRALISEWLPLATVLFETVVDKFPAPTEITPGKTRRILQEQILREEDRIFSADLEETIAMCNSKGPVLGYITKVFPISIHNKMEASVQHSGAMIDIAAKREACRKIKASQVRDAIEKAQNAILGLPTKPTYVETSNIDLLTSVFPKIIGKPSIASLALDTPSTSKETLTSDTDRTSRTSIDKTEPSTSTDDLFFAEPLEKPVIADSADDPNTLARVMEMVEHLKLDLKESNEDIFKIPGSQHEVIAMVRIFSGTLQRGGNLYLIPPTHSPALLNNAADANMVHHVMRSVIKFPVTEMFMILGKDVVEIQTAAAGNIVGLGQLHKYGVTVRSGTVSSTLDCNPLIETSELSDPFFKCSVIPKNIDDYPILVAGLKMLVQTDSCAQCVLQENGEYILVTSGHVHLEKCVEDLSTFTEIEFTLSEPTVHLRESLGSRYFALPGEEVQNTSVDLEHHGIKVATHVHPMPEMLHKLILANFEVLKCLENVSYNDEKSFKTIMESPSAHRVYSSINMYLATMTTPTLKWDADSIISIGNTKEDCCVLLNLSKDNRLGSIFQYQDVPEQTAAILKLFKNAFQLAIRTGPLCDEPVRNVVFMTFDLEVNPHMGASVLTYFAGQILNDFKKLLLVPMKALLPRLCEPLYYAKLSINTNLIGKISQCLDQFRGRITLSSVIARGLTELHFLVPVLESSEFSESLRKVTQGKVNPLLQFSHYEMIPQCPLLIAAPAEEDEHELKTFNIAHKILNDVRRRKGLTLDEKLIDSAEKQRTLKKNK